jgi:hypothetical protein
MVWLEVVARVIVPVPEFFILYILPVMPTAVGKVTVKVPVVQLTV